MTKLTRTLSARGLAAWNAPDATERTRHRNRLISGMQAFADEWHKEYELRGPGGVLLALVKPQKAR